MCATARAGMMGTCSAGRPSRSIEIPGGSPWSLGSDGDGTMGCRVIVTTGLATIYLVGCLAALSLLFSMWSPSL